MWAVVVELAGVGAATSRVFVLKCTCITFLPTGHGVDTARAWNDSLHLFNAPPSRQTVRSESWNDRFDLCDLNCLAVDHDILARLVSALEVGQRRVQKFGL